MRRSYWTSAPLHYKHELDFIPNIVEWKIAREHLENDSYQVLENKMSCNYLIAHQCECVNIACCADTVWLRHHGVVYVHHQLWSLIRHGARIPLGGYVRHDIWTGVDQGCKSKIGEVSPA